MRKLFIFNRIAIGCFFYLTVLSGVCFGQTGWVRLTNQNSTAELTGLWFTSANNGTIVGFDSTILHTTDGGISWLHERNRVPGLNGVNFSDSLHGHIASDETVISTTDGGHSWSVPFDPGAFENIRSVFFSDSATGIAIGDTSIWHFGYIPGIGEASYREYIPGTPRDMSFTADKKYGIISGTGYGFLLTGDSGYTWHPPALPFEGESLNGVAMLKAGSAIGTCYGGAYRRTDNGGETWGDPTVIDSGVDLGAVCFPDPQHGTIVGLQGTIFHTTNGGETWSRQESGTTEPLYAVFFLDDNNGWIVGDHGTILHTTTGGEGAANSVKNAAPTKPIPALIDLLNPSSLRYDVPFDADVQISLFDATGEERIPLIAEHEIQGQYSVRLNRILPNGIYFYRIRALGGDGNLSDQTGKIIILH